MKITTMMRYVLIVIIAFLAITTAQNAAAQNRINFFKGELISAPKNGIYSIPYLQGEQQQYVFLGQKIPKDSKYIGKGKPRANIIDGKVTTNCYRAALRLRIFNPNTGITHTEITDLPCSYLPECQITVLEFLNLDIPEVGEAVKKQHERSGIR